MAGQLGIAIGMVAPMYNAILAAICFVLFIRLFKNHDTFHSKPWKFVFYALVLFIIETIITLIRQVGIFDTPRWILALMEMAMILFIINAILVQMDHMKKFGEDYA
ncbi:hypothetical protein J4460_06145 [Candidatus Woesearchaeota archaeon]|nr:hypothetical protein [Candidatus Woesearchaeota archaeon]HIH37579.1 hypothetical protein [Candidatus Woesearchaeota archaeon]HIH47992.1 hypothetical protein [Candidatus Woesearchaeota archaeon]HIJ03680.1 hypothetical protein [Candidatus Woesearchaeota archaeon]